MADNAFSHELARFNRFPIQKGQHTKAIKLELAAGLFALGGFGFIVIGYASFIRRVAGQVLIVNIIGFIRATGNVRFGSRLCKNAK